MLYNVEMLLDSTVQSVWLILPNSMVGESLLGSLAPYCRAPYPYYKQNVIVAKQKKTEKDKKTREEGNRIVQSGKAKQKNIVKC